MKKAFIVSAEARVRVIVDVPEEDSGDEEAIEAAQGDIIDSIMSDYRSLVEVEEDEECPYGTLEGEEDDQPDPIPEEQPEPAPESQAMLTIAWQHIPLDHIGVAEMHATFKPTPGEGCRDFILTVPDLEELATYEGYKAIGACDTFAALLNRVNAAGANYLMITF